MERLATLVTRSSATDVLLIVGGESDPNTQRVVDQAHIRGLPYHFHDTDLADSHQIAWDFKSPKIDLGNVQLTPSAVFLRWNVFGESNSLAANIHETVQAYTLSWPQLRILNRETLCDRNIKSLNLRLARELGMTIPDTLVLSELSPLATMPQPEKWVAKPLNGGAHTVSVSQLAQQATDPANPPASVEAWFIQEKLAGENLRVFVIGGQAFCFHLVTSELDYREDPNVGVVRVETPVSILEPSRQLAAQIGFDYCALDFRCRDGFEDPVFLEVNSFPMFVRFDDAGENCLVEAMLDFLCVSRA